MKVTFDTTKNEVDFGILVAGETFIDYDYDENSVLMVVEPMIEVNLTTNKTVSGGKEFCGYAVDLDTGAIIGYHYDEKVIRADAKVIVKR